MIFTLKKESDGLSAYSLPSGSLDRRSEASEDCVLVLSVSNSSLSSSMITRQSMQESHPSSYSRDVQGACRTGRLHRSILYTHTCRVTNKSNVGKIICALATNGSPKRVFYNRIRLVDCMSVVRWDQTLFFFEYEAS